MKSTLRQKYEQKRVKRLVEKLDTVNKVVIYEDISDYFKSGSDNIKKFNASLEQIKGLASKYNMGNLTQAITNAEQKFETTVSAQASAGQKPDQNKSQILSSVTSFVTIMTGFLKTLNTVTAQLPSIKNAAAKAPDQPLRQALGGDAQKFTTLIANQFKKSSGGAMQTLARFFKGGGGQNAQQVLGFFGLNPQKVAEDLMNLNGQQFQDFSTGSSETQTPQIQTQQPTPNNNKTTEKTTSPAQPVETQKTQPGEGTTPTQGTQNVASKKPDPDVVSKRDVAIQKAVKNRNAFNTQILGGLSNQEIVNDIHSLVKALGIKL